MRATRKYSLPIILALIAFTIILFRPMSFVAARLLELSNGSKVDLARSARFVK